MINNDSLSMQTKSFCLVCLNLIILESQELFDFHILHERMQFAWSAQLEFKLIDKLALCYR